MHWISLGLWYTVLRLTYSFYLTVLDLYAVVGYHCIDWCNQYILYKTSCLSPISHYIEDTSRKDCWDKDRRSAVETQASELCSYVSYNFLCLICEIPEDERKKLKIESSLMYLNLLYMRAPRGGILISKS